MGRDKTCLPSPPYPTLVERQLAILCAIAPCERLVSARVDQVLPPLGSGAPPRVVRDDGVAGPLGGLVAVLRAVRAPRVLVLGVDVARIDSGMLRRIVGAAPDVADDVGVVPRTMTAPQPLAALWPRAVLPLAEAQLAAGDDLSLRRLVAQAVAAGLLLWFEVPAWHERYFANWNHPADLRCARFPRHVCHLIRDKPFVVRGRNVT